MQKVSSIALLITIMFFLSVDLGHTRGGEKEILEATMTIITDDAQPSVHANRILLPARMQARVQERAESLRRSVNGPVLVLPAKNQMGNERLKLSPFQKKQDK